MVAVLMVMASSAFACTVYLGKVTLTPNGTGSSGSVTAEGDGSGMGYCSGPTGTADMKQNSPSGNTVSVTAAATTSCSGKYKNNSLKSSTTYQLYWATGGTSVDCMGGASGTNVGSVTTDSSGNITTAQSSSAFVPSVGTFQFCLTEGSTPPTGNQLGLTGVA